MKRYMKPTFEWIPCQNEDIITESVAAKDYYDGDNDVYGIEFAEIFR